MAKVKILGLDNLLSRIELAIRKDVATNKLLTDVGEFIVERVRATTRSGKSLSTGKKLKRLSKSYIEMRQGIVKFRTINGRRVPFQEPDERLKEVDTQFFSPDYSNLTFTGQMLRALRYITNSTAAMVVVDVKDSSRRGKYEKLTNDVVAQYVADNGRPFVALDKTGVARVKAIIKDGIRKSFKRAGLKK